MEISQLLESIKELTVQIPAIPEIDITGIEMNSQKVQDGFIFIAVPGYTFDGHLFIEDAIQRGAAVIVGEHGLDLAVPYIRVTNSRKAVARLASTFYGYPASKHKLIGITGTNGKTTISYMLKHILDVAGLSCSLLGTVSYIINGEKVKSGHTTPDAIELQKLLAKSDDEFVIMEVSSHALDQFRVECLEFDLAIFTNLGHEHLDYHHTMENYFSVKSSLFHNYLKKGGKAIINHLDEWGVKLSQSLLVKQIDMITIGNPPHNDICIDEIEIGQGSRFRLTDGSNQHPVNLTFPGVHNMYNAALAFSAAKLVGIPEETIIRALATFDGVPGRFEIYAHPSGATFVIDYAHTRDAVEYCLQTAQSLGAKHISHIYGFRGGRDTTKREQIVQTSAVMSDNFTLTFDDLNGVEEDSMEIELMRLADRFGNGRGKVIPDRTLAILYAWLDAREGDWIFITGKGPESYKELFSLPASSDREMIETLMQDEYGTFFM
ncbi:UDP-N-acetylmuramoyl-L-alanyl-D-glutamate--2,6-diaminopimelate ligase [Bacillus sp. V59.32b]|uniref:UDP-N-acetylmuramoyl-L-alanyl-D-glutamate--2, 6-diaminopimelate ligase n=1 Tax=Bacillus sp. V59.32b TaxID=1758642 RepID=UPI000E3C0E29|nr:UDP-N-acetylmuramoyl-L-alanyl-D-glutamate--2,6-diaminopimelate ligase [Bacillus sp. V59.32b]RFU60077.1 UDP-N-acetylmuramoyl-L-alanyl-D-glutamate--2,6-diaminopimelate ligase [Bacillus sp. V59.32b]